MGGPCASCRATGYETVHADAVACGVRGGDSIGPPVGLACGCFGWAPRLCPGCFAGVAELADAADLKSASGNRVPVRSRPPAPGPRPRRGVPDWSRSADRVQGWATLHHLTSAVRSATVAHPEPRCSLPFCSRPVSARDRVSGVMPRRAAIARARFRQDAHCPRRLPPRHAAGDEAGDAVLGAAQLQVHHLVDHQPPVPRQQLGGGAAQIVGSAHARRGTRRPGSSARAPRSAATAEAR